MTYYRICPDELRLMDLEILHKDNFTPIFSNYTFNVISGIVYLNDNKEFKRSVVDLYKHINFVQPCSGRCLIIDDVQIKLLEKILEKNKKKLDDITVIKTTVNLEKNSSWCIIL